MVDTPSTAPACTVSARSGRKHDGTMLSTRGSAGAGREKRETRTLVCELSQQSLCTARGSVPRPQQLNGAGCQKNLWPPVREMCFLLTSPLIEPLFPRVHAFLATPR